MEEDRQVFAVREGSLRMASICTIPFFYPSQRKMHVEVLQDIKRQLDTISSKFLHIKRRVV
jgi:hypothetical protein